MNKKVNFNGDLFGSDEKLLSANNRAFMYGDAMFETIRVLNGEVLFFEDHFSRLKSGMDFLQMRFPEQWDSEYLKKQILGLINTNGHTSARVRLEVYRQAGGYYTPENNEAGFIIQSEELKEDQFVLNTKGYKIDAFKDLLKPLGKLSSVKSSNCLIYVLAGLYKKEHGLDDCLILNTTGKVAETITSNIFIVRGGAFYTPPLKDGCVAGVMRQQIFKIAENSKKQVHEWNLNFEDLLSADEIFLTNAINGIRWVGAFKNKRYFNNTSKWFVDQLNELVKDSRQPEI